MLRFTVLFAAIHGVNGAAHANASNATTNATTAPTTAAPTTAAPVATAKPNVTAAPATTAAPVVTTAAPVVTKAVVTKAPVETKAPEKPVEKETMAPTTMAPTTVDPRAGCGNDTTSANCTTTAAPIITEKIVKTEIKVTLSLDISAFTADEKVATGNGIAFGIHDSACEGVKDMWETKGKCLTGQSKVDGISFDMQMGIDSQLVDTQPGCTETDCYGEPAPARQLAAVTLSNAGDFGVKISGAALADTTTDYTAQATAAINTAKASGAFQPAAVQAALANAFNRTSVRAAVGDKVTALVASAATATVEVADATVAIVTQAPTVPVAPGTSGAYTAGAASALALIAGVFLF